MRGWDADKPSRVMRAKLVHVSDSLFSQEEVMDLIAKIESWQIVPHSTSAGLQMMMCVLHHLNKE